MQFQQNKLLLRTQKVLHYGEQRPGIVLTALASIITLLMWTSESSIASLLKTHIERLPNFDGIAADIIW